jgi:enoyl-CoA hydratase
MNKWLKSTETILFTVTGSIARITLNRPDKRNAINEQMQLELEQALLEADDRRDVNVILLEGAGKDFCSGYDLQGTYGGNLEKGPAYDPALYRSNNASFDDDAWNLERSQERRLRIFDIHKPVIAKVHGNCLAGGTDLAFLCDLVIAADDARIGFPAARANGTPPTQMWLYHIGPQWSKRLLFTGDVLSGADAARLGLVLDAYAADRLEEEVWALATRIALTDVELLATHKRAVNVGLELMGARTLQRMIAEADVRGHLSQGPRRMQFKSDAAQHGLKTALKNRDAGYGDGAIKLNRR